MRRWLSPLVVASAILLSAAGAGHAMPVAPSPRLHVPIATPVSGGCGPYAHRGFFGRCRLNIVRPYGFYRPFRFYRPFVFIRRPFFRFGPGPGP